MKIDNNNPIPKYLQLKEILTSQIRKEFEAGDRFFNLRQLMNEYDVALTTIRQAISELEKEGLVYREQGRGTFVKKPEIKEEINLQILYNRPSTLRESSPLGWFVAFDILQGILDGCGKFNCKPNLVDISSKKPFINESQGIIVIGNRPKLIEKLREKGYLVVGTHVVAPKPEGNSVTNDWEKPVYTGVTHLLNLGHKRVGFIGGPISSRYFYSRWRGYKKALKKRGIPFQKELTRECQGREEDGYRAMLSLLSLKERPTAVFASTDSRAIGAIKAIKEKRLRVPEDIAVVGYDDIPEASTCQPPLTTLHIPRYESGYEAVKLLRQLIREEKKEPQTIILPAKLIIRKSCGAKGKKLNRRSSEAKEKNG